ncbi:MAG: excalibur calcium-binding domain-containing protein [Rhodobacteraceae bacterium]|nr:excalibur calcium-binding domain-containing protein [Paracoccaceae bacterium]
MRLTVALISLAALAACETPVPDSGSGVGFGSYAEYQAEREAQLIAGGEGSGTATAGLDTQAISAEATAAIDAAEAESAAPTGPAPSAVTNAVGISSENDFSAVSSERSIEEDAALVAANKEAYVTIQPTALPSRPNSDAGTIVEFALSTTNTVGQALYSRLIPGAESRAARNCAKYPSPDLAQEYFLKHGGPEKNPQGLDPDGDGFACSWDPAPFRLAAKR